MCAGGTSASVGLWAGVAAVLNGAAPGGKLIGFANPTLYRLAFTVTSYGTYFHDVGGAVYANDNNQYNTTGLNNFHASTGYDLATGLGTPTAGPSHRRPAPPSQCHAGRRALHARQRRQQDVTAFVPNGSWGEAPPARRKA